MYRIRDGHSRWNGVENWVKSQDELGIEKRVNRVTNRLQNYKFIKWLKCTQKLILKVTTTKIS